MTGAPPPCQRLARSSRPPGRRENLYLNQNQVALTTLKPVIPGLDTTWSGGMQVPERAVIRST
jgi:hypothetical protein